MRDVAIIAFAPDASTCGAETDHNEVEMLMPVSRRRSSDGRLTKDDIGFTCSG